MPTPNAQNFDKQKEQAVQAALLALKPGITLGLGSGSTAELFIQRLAQWPAASSLKLCSSSEKSRQLAEAYHLKVFPIETFEQLDLVIDGADFVDNQNRLLKGFGGALVREKILASLAKELWILIDQRKKVTTLPLNRLPLEIIPSAYRLIQKQLSEKPITFKLRLSAGLPFISDNGGLILDLDASAFSASLEELSRMLKQLTGVIDHGLFLDFNVRLFEG